MIVTGVQEEGPHLIPQAIASQLSIMHFTYSDSACSQPRFAFCNHAPPHLSPSPFKLAPWGVSAFISGEIVRTQSQRIQTLPPIRFQ